MTLTTLIFDFDGTLANSLDATLEIANRLAPEFGYRAARADEIDALRATSYIGISEQLGISWHKIPLIAARVRKELKAKVASLESFAGLPEVLSELRANRIRLGILTSNDRSNVERFLRVHGLDGFEFIWTSSSLWGKRQRLKSLLRRQQLQIGEVAYVGDEVRDIEAAKQLGVRMIAVGWGYATAAHLAAHAPDHLARMPSELLTIVQAASAQ